MSCRQIDYFTISALGPVIPANVWTHVAVVYSSTNDVRLFINGQFSTSSSNTGTLSIQDINTPQYITSGNIGSIGPSAWISCQKKPEEIRKKVAFTVAVFLERSEHF